MADPDYHHVSVSENGNDDSDLDDDEVFDHGVHAVNKEEKEIYPWNIFKHNPPEDETQTYEDLKLYIYTIKTLKILTYIFVFLIVLGTAVVSKMTILLMTSQLKPGTSRHLCYNVPGRKRIVDISIHERIQWTWALLFCFMIPEVGTFFRSVRIWLFKNPKKPNWLEFCVPLGFQLCHAFGLALLTFVVLPSMHVIKAAMLSSTVFFIPGILLLLSRGPSKMANTTKGRSWIVFMIIDGSAILCQLYGFTFWPYLVDHDETNEVSNPWMFPVAAILTSFGWWENFVSANSTIGFVKTLGEMRKRLERTRHYSYIFISLIKMAVFFATMCLSIFLVHKDDPFFYFKYFDKSFNTTNLTAIELGQPISHGLLIKSAIPQGNHLIIQKVIFVENSYRAADYSILVQFLAAWVCYITAKFACKIRTQGFSFAFPLTLSVPVTMAVLVSMCGMRNDDVCVAERFLPNYLYWTCPTGSFDRTFLTKEYGWIWILFFLSQIWIVLHIWQPCVKRLASTEDLFCFPMYNALLTDSDLMLNRKNDFERKTNLQKKDSVSGYPGSSDLESFELDLDFDLDLPGGVNGSMIYVPTQDEDDKVPKIIACATMWHEEEAEMICMFKSVFRMDADQSARRVARSVFGVNDPSYYEYETHIFFDDAFKPKSDKRNTPIINDYVRKMLPAIDKAASLVHEMNISIGAPRKIPTPYGGRLEWLLPGKTKLTIHLKNKDKIRHRKRWSQVMYMYYLLGYKISANQEYTEERQDVIAANTFILALDGDIDFQPNAVELLVDLMKKNKDLGAACGRIHPIGTGPMVWYQKFEYAIGHWLQKATEHMIGCVLCSPGCFSLFRAEALMDDNVMAKYTTPPTEPRHYVQYDQGEDRWLCTLLLQQKWRVEYCAASDALTHAPEGFNEFFNQRRRWIPSTMANVMDLLMDYKRTVKVNPNISFPYILYQSIMMGGSILGPGTIFLMLVGAFVAAFKIDNFSSLYLNIAPILGFIMCCYFCKAKTQLKLAQFLSVIYALVMVAVLVAIVLQLVEDGILAPSSIFLVAITLSFVVSALAHPLEFGCLIHGVVYYITIPSMYLLLIIYSLFNLNDVTWGTRENPELAAAQKKAAKLAAAAGGRKKSFLAGIIPDKWLEPGEGEEEGSMELNCAGLFKLACCTHPKPKDELTEVIVKLRADLAGIKKQLTTTSPFLKRQNSNSSSTSATVPSPGPVTSGGAESGGRAGSSKGHHVQPPTIHLNCIPEADTDNEDLNSGVGRRLSDVSNKSSKSGSGDQETDDLFDPPWLEDKDLKRGEVDYLTSIELEFWVKMMTEYLLPLEQDPQQQKEMEAGLLDLRNKVVGAFFMINAVFVTAMFLLQINKDKLYLEWPLGGKHNMTWDDTTDTMTVNTEYLHLEPLGLLFVTFYALILVIQFTAMLFHRFGTYAHIMASTLITLFDRGSVDHDKQMDVKSIKVIQQLQKIKTANEDSSIEGSIAQSSVVLRRKTVIDHKSKLQKDKIQTLDRAFEKRMAQFEKAPDKFRRTSRINSSGPDYDAVDSLLSRRDTFIAERRNSRYRSRRGRLAAAAGSEPSSIIEGETASAQPPPPPPPPPPPNSDAVRNWRERKPLPESFYH